MEQGCAGSLPSPTGGGGEGLELSPLLEQLVLLPSPACSAATLHPTQKDAAIPPPSGEEAQHGIETVQGEAQVEAEDPGEGGTLWGQPHQLRWALWHGGGDAEDKGKERERSDVPLCPEGNNSSPSNQNVPAGVVGTAEKGTLQMEVLGGCSSLDVHLAQGVAHSPGGLAGDELRIGSPLGVLLCSPAWMVSLCGSW